MVNQHFGKVIEAERRVKGLTASKLAATVGISPSYLSLIEQGKRTNIKRSIVFALKSALNIDEVRLLEEGSIKNKIIYLNSCLLNFNDSDADSLIDMKEITNLMYEIIKENNSKTAIIN